MNRLLALLFATALVSGCRTADDALVMSSTPATITDPSASAVAGDMASRLAEQIGPVRTTAIMMNKDNSDYANALEAALKGWGYTVITDGKASKDKKPTELAWSVDIVDGQVLAQLTTPSIALSRAYLPTSAGATPASPVSILQRN